MHQQFKRELNVEIVHGQALQNFIWIYYVYNTPQASSYATVNNHINWGGLIENTNKEGGPCLLPTAIDHGNSS